MTNKELPVIDLETLKILPLGRVLYNKDSFRLVLVKTIRIHKCVVCGEIMPKGKHITSMYGSKHNDRLHLACYDKFNFQVNTTTKLHLPTTAMSFKASNLETNIQKAIQEISTVYKDTKWSVIWHGEDYGWNVSCGIKSTVCSESIKLHWTANILKRRLAELLAYTLEQEEGINERPIR